MTLFIFLLCSLALQPVIQHYSVFGKPEVLRRFIVEEGVKPPIFGSYNYDPLKQTFETIPPAKNRSAVISQIVNSSHILSTAVGTVTTTLRTTINENETETITEALYRKRVTAITKHTQHRESADKLSKLHV